MTVDAPIPWWQSLYDDIVADLFLIRKDPGEAGAILDFLWNNLQLKTGDTIFDQGCGTGGLALPLARSGVRIVGVDQAEAYIARSRSEAEDDGLACEFHVGDARTFIAATSCEAGFNWNTSFGNADDEGNQQMLRCAWKTLQPGGRFALDYQHIAHVLHRFKGCMVRRRIDNQGEMVLLRESTVDLAAGALRQRWTFVFPDGRRDVRHSAIRLYLPHVLADMLREAGFVDVEFHGGVRGEPLTLDSPRCILLGRRPGP